MVSFSARTAAQKFGVYGGKLRRLPLEFQMRGDASAGLLALLWRFEQELFHPTSAQTLNEVIKRSVLETTAAAAVFFAAGQVLPDIRSADQIGRQVQLGQQRRVALLQCRKGKLLGSSCLNHNYT